MPAGCACGCGRRVSAIAYQANITSAGQSGATGFKYGFKKLWDTPPYSYRLIYHQSSLATSRTSHLAAAPHRLQPRPYSRPAYRGYNNGSHGGDSRKELTITSHGLHRPLHVAFSLCRRAFRFIQQ